MKWFGLGIAFAAAAPVRGRAAQGQSAGRRHAVALPARPRVRRGEGARDALPVARVAQEAPDRPPARRLPTAAGRRRLLRRQLARIRSR